MPLVKRLTGNRIPFSKLVLRDRKLRSLSREKNHPIAGLDTETLNGYCKLIADHDGNYKLVDTVEDILTYLTHYRFRSHHNFFFNLRYDMNAIIKYLPRENLEELYKGGRTNYDKYRISYIPKKLFSVTHSRHVHKFYDIAQFYETSLDKASKKYLHEGKYTVDIDPKILGTSSKYWDERLPDIIKYCIHDASLTKRLGDLLQDTLISKVKLTPQTYISKATLSKEYARKNTFIPDIRRVDSRVLRYAFNSYHGGRFEILKKGKVGKCTLIDINSAYPYQISKLVDTTKGTWRRTKTVHENAIYGYYIVKVMTKWRDICPLAYQYKGLVTCYPVINFTTYLTKNELLAYENDIVYDIILGWEYFDESPTYPFKHIIDNLYYHKQHSDKKHYEYKLYKKIMNALYGSFYEKIKRGDEWYVGKLFNPMYATEITANTRIQCFEESKKYGKRVVGFATDSLLIEGDVKLPETNKLGEWDVQSQGNAIVLRSGIYKIGKKLKERGIQKIKNIKTPMGEYKNIFDYIKLQPQLEVYPIIINRPVNFVEALLHHKVHTVEDINLFQDHEYKIYINRDHKRLWDDTFGSGGELYKKKIESEPYIIE